MAASPNFGNAPYVRTSVVSAANSAYDGTGTLTEIASVPSTYTHVPPPTVSGGTYTAANSVSQPSNGILVDRVIVRARGTSVAGHVLIWISDGTTHSVVASAEVTVIAASTTVAPWTASIDLGGLRVPSGYTLRATVTTATTLSFAVLGEVL